MLLMTCLLILNLRRRRSVLLRRLLPLLLLMGQVPLKISAWTVGGVPAMTPIATVSSSSTPLISPTRSKIQWIGPQVRIEAGSIET